MNSVPTNQRYGQIRRGRMAADIIGEHFTQISNAALRDPRLSFKARGVLAWLASHQDGYGCSVAAIEAHSDKDGREAIRSALRELEEFGYLSMEQTRDPVTGRVGPSDYVVTDIPSAGDPSTGNPFTGLIRENGASSQVTPVNGLAVDGKSPTKNTRPKNTSKNIPSDSSSSAPRSTRELADDDARTTGMNPDQFSELVGAVTALRPEWQAPGVRAQVAQVAHLPYELVREAFLESAGDRKFYTPMHLATAALDRAAQVERKAAKDEERERDQDDWRRQVHEDVSNRADPVTRARYLADLKRVAQEKRSASKVAAAGA